METVSKNILRNIYKVRAPRARKYDFGLVLVIGGSEYYSGSPALSGLAAFRAGVDMVRIVAPRRAADIIASFSPNLSTTALEGKWLTEKHLSVLEEATESAKAVTEGKTAVVIGGGLGRTRETQKAIRQYFSRVSVPAVVDADAIYALAQNPDVFKGRNFLFTPHSYEFFALTGKKVAGEFSLEERIRMVREQAQKLQTTILLKGEVDIISDGKNTAINKEGSPFLTVGGTGDTLAGIAGALIARGCGLFEAGCGAAYINGRAGAAASRKFGEAVLATDLIKEIYRVVSVNGARLK